MGYFEGFLLTFKNDYFVSTGQYNKITSFVAYLLSYDQLLKIVLFVANIYIIHTTAEEPVIKLKLNSDEKGII